MHFWCTVTSVRTMKIADGIIKPLIVPLFHGKPCWEQLQARTYDLEDCYTLPIEKILTLKNAQA